MSKIINLDDVRARKREEFRQLKTEFLELLLSITPDELISIMEAYPEILGSISDNHEFIFVHTHAKEALEKLELMRKEQ